MRIRKYHHYEEKKLFTDRAALANQSEYRIGSGSHIDSPRQSLFDAFHQFDEQRFWNAFREDERGITGYLHSRNLFPLVTNCAGQPIDSFLFCIQRCREAVARVCLSSFRNWISRCVDKISHFSGTLDGNQLFPSKTLSPIHCIYLNRKHSSRTYSSAPPDCPLVDLGCSQGSYCGEKSQISVNDTNVPGGRICQ